MISSPRDAFRQKHFLICVSRSQHRFEIRSLQEHVSCSRSLNESSDPPGGEIKRIFDKAPARNDTAAIAQTRHGTVSCRVTTLTSSSTTPRCRDQSRRQRAAKRLNHPPVRVSGPRPRRILATSRSSPSQPPPSPRKDGMQITILGRLAARGRVCNRLKDSADKLTRD